MRRLFLRGFFQTAIRLRREPRHPLSLTALCLVFVKLQRHRARMDRDTVIAKLRAHEAELRAEGVAHVYLFGSVARDKAGGKSDIDLFYDYDPDRFGFLQFMRIREIAPEIMGQSVDIMPRDGIHPLIRSEIEESAIEVF